jgi:hypothetical protein
MSRLSKETNQIDEVVDVWPERQNDRIVLWRAADEEAQLAEKVVKLGSSETKHRENTVNLKKIQITLFSIVKCQENLFSELNMQDLFEILTFYNQHFLELVSYFFIDLITITTFTVSEMII